MSTPGRATIADVAALAGVSRAAVSKVFNDRGSISEATATRIRDAAIKLNWTPSAAAVALRRSRAMTVGLAVNRGGKGTRSGTTTEGLISGIEYVLSRRGYGLLFYEFAPGAVHEAELYRRLADTRQVDGVILTNSRVGDTRFQLLRDIGLPAGPSSRLRRRDEPGERPYWPGDDPRYGPGALGQRRRVRQFSAATSTGRLQNGRSPGRRGGAGSERRSHRSPNLPEEYQFNKGELDVTCDDEVRGLGPVLVGVQHGRR